MIWSTISGLRIDGNTFAHCRINVRHNHSDGTTITNNGGTATEENLFVDSAANLQVSANTW